MPQTTSPHHRSLTHLSPTNSVHMVDVSHKSATLREASARGVVTLPPACAKILRAGGATRKGNVFEVARLAGIMAAKNTSSLIPLCHPLPLSGVDISLTLKKNTLIIIATARCHGATGVEMEALTAASVTALTLYDMLKAVSHDMVIGPLELLHKSGGKSGLIDRRKSLK
jgi:cyclic pyranopterin monophosphate synthase